MSRLTQAYREMKSKLDAETREYNLAFSFAAYQEAAKIMREYEISLHGLITKHTTYRHTAQQIEQANERLEELAAEVDELQGELNDLADKQSQKEQNIAEIEKQLELEGVAAIRKQIREVQDELAETNQELDQIKSDLPAKNPTKRAG